MTTPRVRFAPSPTGYLHIGGARTALFNWLYARKHKGTFILRMEDTDRERSTPASVKAIIDGLTWLGIDWDEGPLPEDFTKEKGAFGPYFQTARIARYLQVANQLISEGKAYRCVCTKEELTAKREAHKKATGIADGWKYDQTCRKANHDGRKVGSWIIPANTTQHQIDLDDAAPGIYQLRYSYGIEAKCVKVIVE